MKKLRWYQLEAIQSLLRYFKDNPVGAPLIVAPTGAGKSHIISGFVEQSLAEFPAMQFLIVAHRKELLGQNREKLGAGTFYCAGLGQKKVSQITFGTIGSVYKKAELFQTVQVLIIDECFTGDTLISTPYGQKPISEIKVLDEVYHATGCGKVLAVSKKQVNTIYKVRTSNGKTIKCTGNHPFFTEQGWVVAKDLERGQRVISLQEVPKLWKQVFCSKGEQVSKGEHISKNKILLNILLKEIGKPDVACWCERKNDSHFEKNRTQAKSTRGKWLLFDSSTKKIIRNIGRCVASGACNQNWSRALQWCLSKLLQSRFREHRRKDCYRARWFQSLCFSKKSERYKERCLPSKVRVESVENEELTNSELVYNLQVSGHPSYFAENLLVHNCHLIPKESKGRYQQLIAELRLFNPQLRVFGLTATPYRMDSGKLYGKGCIFSEIAYECDLLRLMKEGYLSPIIGKEAITKSNTSELHLRMGEFIPAEIESLFMQTIIQQCQEILKYAEGRKRLLIFCSGIKHAEAVASTLFENGAKVASLTGKNNKKERTKILESFKNKSLDIITNCDILTTGFDAPDIDLIALLRPTQSLGLYVQMLGRGLRIAEGKENCLVLDFGNNIKRHGRLEDIDHKALEDGNTTEQKAKVKICKTCQTANSLTADECQECHTSFMQPCKKCGHLIPVKDYRELDRCPSCKEYLNTRSLGDIVSAFYSRYGLKKVEDVQYSIHNKFGSPPMMRVTYLLENKAKECEYICMEHSGFAGTCAISWCLRHLKQAPPDRSLLPKTASELVEAAPNIFKKPVEIFLAEGKTSAWPEITVSKYA